MGRLQVNLNFDNVSLLLPFDNNFQDYSKNNFNVTVNGSTQISTAQSKFGGASAYFDGNGDYLNLSATSAFNFYNTNYTIEMWIYRTASQSGGALISTRNAAEYSSWELQVNSNNTIGLLVQNDADSWYIPFGVAPIVGNTTIQQNTWTHVAWVCNGSNTTVYVNGVADSSLTNLNIPILQAFAQPLNIYIGSGGDGAFNGYIDDLRITKGVARYTSNFTPPSKLLLNINNKISIKKQNLGGGKINLKKKYLYRATGTGLTPNINGLRFYDSGETFYTNKVFYDETNTYMMWISPVGYWFIKALPLNPFAPAGPSFRKAFSNSGEPPTGNYVGGSGYIGTVTISSI